MANTKNGSNYPPVHGDSTQDWIRRYQEIDAERGALKAENEWLRALLVRTDQYIVGQGSAGLLTEIRATLAATKDAALTCVKCGEIEGAHDEQEVVQVGHEFIAPKK
jgi:hypothetical protein